MEGMIIMVIVVVMIILIVVAKSRNSNKERESKSHVDAAVSSGNSSITVAPKNPIASKGQDTNKVPKVGSFEQKQVSDKTVQTVGPIKVQKTSVAPTVVKSALSAKKEVPYYRIQQIPFLPDVLNIDYSKHFYVNYELNSSEKFEYPYLKAPQKGVEIKLPVRGRSAMRGFCEEKLCDVIKECKLDKFKDNLTLIVKDCSCPYEPDLVYIDIDKGIFIDIEVDEPYAGLERIPIHYKIGGGTHDDLRNQYFIERGWIVLRFSEKQVFKQAKSCLKYLYQIISRIDNSIVMPAALVNVPDLEVDHMWTKDESISMATNKEREKMLGISGFYLSGVCSMSGNPSDYAGAEKIEKAIEALRDDDKWKQLSARRLWNKYIDSCPHGRHVAEAKKKIDDELWTVCKENRDYDRYLRQSELQRYAVIASNLKAEDARIKAENVRKEMERIKAMQEETRRKEEEQRLERERREEEERKKREAENYARRQVSFQTQAKAPSSRGYA